MDELDKYIESTVKKEIHTPIKFENSIKSAFSKNKKSIKTFNIYKIVSLTCACIIGLVGFVYAKDIKNIIQNFYNSSKGLDTAIENDYINYTQAEYIDSNGTSVKVDNMLMDDYNLSMTFSLILNDSINVGEIGQITLQDMIITDEENRIIYCENEKAFNDYCQRNNLGYEYGKNNDNYINSGSNWYIKNRLEETNTTELIYNLYATTFPKSKKLFIHLTQIDISKQDAPENKLIMNGDWNIELDVPEKFYNRESTIYTVKSVNDNTVNITDASVYDTCMKFAFNTFAEPLYNENDPDDVKDKKHEERLAWMWELTKAGKNMAEDEYVENSNGKIFYPTRSSDVDTRVDYLYDGKISYLQTFNLTKYDMTDNLKVHLILNTMEGSREIIVELERR